jgi:uncharacterized protein (TIGR02246 family)
MSDTAGSDTAITAIRHVREAFVAADRANDGDAMGRLLTDDVVILHPHCGVIVGWDAAVTFMRHALAELDAEFSKQAQYSTVELRACGDFAYERGEFVQHLTPRDGGAPQHDRGQYLWVYVKAAHGQWKIARIAGAFVLTDDGC